MNEPHTVVVSVMTNHAPVGYNPKWKETVLCRVTGPRVNGKKYWVEAGENPCSQHWLSDEQVLRNWNQALLFSYLCKLN
jgi:hypothetical protein|tara:strand:- start:68 stop:304 length:237 start_codon:yes stop_codon:yes gene_type:complete